MPEAPLEISVTDTAAALRGPDPRPLLLDCRTPEEHATAKIAGAVLIPMQELPERVGELACELAGPVASSTADESVGPELAEPALRLTGRESFG